MKFLIKAEWVVVSHRLISPTPAAIGTPCLVRFVSLSRTLKAQDLKIEEARGVTEISVTGGLVLKSPYPANPGNDAKLYQEEDIKRAIELSKQ